MNDGGGGAGPVNDGADGAASVSGCARAVYIHAGGVPVMALMHDVPEPSTENTGVVLVGPFGWSGMCCARALRRWALRLASAGHPTVRVDLPAGGDSGGSPRDPGLLEAWVGAVMEAAELARSSWGSQRLCVAGVELGGLLAVLALSNGMAVDELILWAVPSTGRALLRQWRAQAAVIAARHPEDRREEQEVLALAGFALHRQVAARLGAVALGRVTWDAAPQRALVLARGGLRADLEVAEILAARGTEVTCQQTEDHDALLAHPQKALAPERTIALAGDWLARAPGGRGSPCARPQEAPDSAPDGVSHAAPAGATGAAPARAPAPRTQITLNNCSSTVVESPLSLKVGGERSFAILTAPENPRPELDDACAVLFNAGALSHVGPNRMWVEAARAWAAQGITTVRVDLPGLGEAGGDERRWVSNPALYHPARLAQAHDLLDGLRAAAIARRFVLGGLCAGATWALRTAVERDDVAGVLAVNLYCFTWDLELVNELETVRALRSLRGSGWRRLARGDVTEEALWARLRSLGLTRLRGVLLRPAQRRQWRQARLILDRLRDRGVHVELLFSRNEPLAALLGRGFAAARWPNTQLASLPTRDHMFRALWVQRRVHELLADGLWRSLSGEPSATGQLSPAGSGAATRCAR
jgi:hypothetical protein